MANKTIVAQLVSLPGANDLTLHLTTEAAPQTTLNGSGTACSLVGADVQSCVVSSSLASYGWLVAQYRRGSIVVARGPILIQGDIAGTYVVDSMRDRVAQPRLQKEYRDAEDVNPIRFYWPVPSLAPSAWSASTKQINSGSSAAISGTINFLRSLTINSVAYHEYELTYNAGDRPANNDRGDVLYFLTDGTNQGQIALGVRAAEVTVLPGVDRALPQSHRGQIVVKLNERINISRSVLDSAGNPISLTGRTLQFVIQDARGVDIATIPNDSITTSGNTYSFDLPAEASARVMNATYSLNDIGASKAELVGGDWIVEPRAIADA